MTDGQNLLDEGMKVTERTKNGHRPGKERQLDQQKNDRIDRDGEKELADG